MKKLFKETIEPNAAYSLTIHNNKGLDTCNTKSWHYHPEIELVCIPEGKGRLNIGNKVFEYTDGVVILMYSNIPHKSFDNDFECEDYHEIVLQIAPEKMTLLNSGFAEFMSIHHLLHAAKEAVVYTFDNDKKELVDLFHSIVKAMPAKKLLLFLELLEGLSQKQFCVLGVESGYNLNTTQSQRIEAVYDYLARNYTKEIDTATVAKMVSMTDSSFCRFFKQHTGKPFKKALHEYRVNKACKALAFTEKTVDQVAYEVGFNHTPFFNRVFKSIMRESPLKYRQMRQG